MLSITPIYAALLTALYVTLSVRVILRRGATDVSLGDGGDAKLLSRIRAQGNCAEYAPLGLILLLIAELQGAPGLALHLLGLALLFGRVSHALALSGIGGMAARAGGMMLTFLMLCVTALGLFFHALF